MARLEKWGGKPQFCMYRIFFTKMTSYIQVEKMMKIRQRNGKKNEKARNIVEILAKRTNFILFDA